MTNKKQAIGIFDSGIGGTSIWKEIQKILPNENTMYLADSKNAPYGQKSAEDIIAFSKKNTEYLLSKGCKIIVVACNTATTNAIKILRNTYNVPFIGIEPAIKPATIKTNTNTIGILATKGTLSSALFEKATASFRKNTIIIEQVGKGLVELVEKGEINSSKMTVLLQKYLNPMLAQNMDSLVLGCTHYPYLIPKIKEIVGDKVTIIDSGLAVAKQTKAILQKHTLLNSSKEKGTYTFYSNKDPKVLKGMLHSIPNTKIEKLDF